MHLVKTREQFPPVMIAAVLAESATASADLYLDDEPHLYGRFHTKSSWKRDVVVTNKRFNTSCDELYLAPASSLDNGPLLANIVEFPLENRRRQSQLESLKKEILKYRQLQPGWDGYDGVAPSLSSVIGAINFLTLVNQEAIDLPKPMLSGDGEIGFYWDQGSVFIDVSFDGGSVLSYYAEGPNVGSTGEDDVVFGTEIPKGLLRTLLMLPNENGSLFSRCQKT
jgi:hypothetical protein